MKNLFLVLVFVLMGTFTFANATSNLNSSDYSNSTEMNISMHNADFEMAVFYTNCVYIVEFQTSEGDVIATFTYTYESDNCSSLHSGLKRRAIAEFTELFL